MTKKEFEIVKDYVNNKLLKGINNLKDAREVYQIIYKTEPIYAAGLDNAIFRWWSFNGVDPQLEEEKPPVNPSEDDSKVILSQVGEDTTTNFEGVKTHPTKSEDMSPEEQSHSEDLTEDEEEYLLLGKKYEEAENSNEKRSLKMKMNALEKKIRN